MLVVVHAIYLEQECSGVHDKCYGVSAGYCEYIFLPLLDSSIGIMSFIRVFDA